MPTPIAASTIVAQAFRFMEASPISSFDDDSEQAQAAAEQYPTALAQCLEAADWSFASTLAFLPPAELPVTGVADPDLPYLFALPGACVRVQEVGDGDVRWRRDSLGLRADDVGPLRIRYTATVSNETSLPANFRLAVALHLAVLLGPRWLTTQSKMQALQSQAEDALKKAIRQDARNASSARYDGGADEGDWVTEAIR
jgi:hypothetical protein